VADATASFPAAACRRENSMTTIVRTTASTSGEGRSDLPGSGSLLSDAEDTESTYRRRRERADPHRPLGLGLVDRLSQDRALFVGRDLAEVAEVDLVVRAGHA